MRFIAFFMCAVLIGALSCAGCTTTTPTVVPTTTPTVVTTPVPVTTTVPVTTMVADPALYGTWNFRGAIVDNSAHGLRTTRSTS